MNENDKLVNELIQQVELKKQTISKLEKPTYLTNMSLEIENIRYNLHVVKPEQLVYLLSKLHRENEDFIMTCKTHNLNYTYTKLGFTFNDWKTDILTKIRIQDISAIKFELEEDEKVLNSLMSEEQKREMKLKELSKKYKS